MLIRAGAAVDKPDLQGYTPLCIALKRGHQECAELLFDAGAKMSNVHSSPIPDWMNGIITKRENVKQGVLAFMC